MVTYGTIERRDITVKYTKEDFEEYMISGNATYNKENKLVNANGVIEDGNRVHVSDFDIYGDGEDTRINLINCLAGKMNMAVEAAEATLADLTSDYPKE